MEFLLRTDKTMKNFEKSCRFSITLTVAVAIFLKTDKILKDISRICRFSMALTQVQGIFLHIFVGTVKSLFKGIFLHILVGTVKSVLQNDTTLKNLRKYRSFQWPRKSSGHF